MAARRLSFRRCGFTMIEALTAVTITAVAGGALLSSIGAAVQSSSDAAHRATARGLAEQLMSEITGCRFPKPTSSRSSVTNRKLFDDIDDYSGWSSKPPQDHSGHNIGTEGSLIFGMDFPRLYQMRPDLDYLSHFFREVVVERVLPDNGTGWRVVTQHTNFRRVTVRVNHTDGQNNTATLAENIQIFSYAPITP